jgi:2-desacetyl-2-hydroxyethyl bacteriochlorophyllide A dehydrogenase
MPKELLFTGPRQIGFREYEERDPGPNEILVETVLTGISHGTEMSIYRGTNPQFRRHVEDGLFVDGPVYSYPMTYGYEEVGRVAKAGAEVKGISEGDIVAAIYGHRQTAVFDPETAWMVTRLPEGADPELGIFQALGSVAMDGVLSANVKLGESCVIFGLGVIGLLSVQLARISGAEPVIGVDPILARRRLAEEYGADAVLDPAAEDVGVRVRELTGGRKADCAIETSGSYKALHESIRCTMSSCGRVVALGFYQGEGVGLNLGEEFHHSSHLSGGAGHIVALNHRLPPAPARAWDTRRVYQTVMRWILCGRVRAKEMVTHRFPFEQAQEAFRTVDEHPAECVKVILTF